MIIADQMLALIEALPEPDKVIARNLINKRSFETLQELVSSAIIKTENNLNKESPKEVYINADLYGMNSLLTIINNYLLEEWIIEEESWEEVITEE